MPFKSEKQRRWYYANDKHFYDDYTEKGRFSKMIENIEKMNKIGLHCKKCGLWLPKRELKKGIKCPECGEFNQI